MASTIDNHDGHEEFKNHCSEIPGPILKAPRRKN